MPVLNRHHTILIALFVFLTAGLVIWEHSDRTLPGIDLDSGPGKTFHSTADSIDPNQSPTGLTPRVLLEGTGTGGRFRVVQYHPFRIPFDINTVSEEMLHLLPGISKVNALKIMHHRKCVKPFRSIEEVRTLLDLDPETFHRIEPLIQVNP